MERVIDCPVCFDHDACFEDTQEKFNSYMCFNCGFKTGWKPGGILGSKFVELLKGLGIDDTTVNKLKIQRKISKSTSS